MTSDCGRKCPPRAMHVRGGLAFGELCVGIMESSVRNGSRGRITSEISNSCLTNLVRALWVAGVIATPDVLRGAPAEQRVTEPTFTRDIAPILFQNCSGCHRPGQSGPFSLLTY